MSEKKSDFTRAMCEGTRTQEKQINSFVVVAVASIGLAGAALIGSKIISSAPTQPKSSDSQQEKKKAPK